MKANRFWVNICLAIIVLWALSHIYAVTYWTGALCGIHAGVSVWGGSGSAQREEPVYAAEGLRLWPHNGKMTTGEFAWVFAVVIPGLFIAACLHFPRRRGIITPLAILS